MFKSLDPKERATCFSPQHPDTVFTVRAFTGVHMTFTSDSVYNQALNECVESITNFAAYVPVKDKAGKDTKETELVEFDEFKPREHSRVKLSAVLPHTIASLVFSKIWSMSTLSRQESGE